MLSAEEFKIKQEQITAKIRSFQPDKGCFPVIDGIIDVKRYVGAKYKILWVLKEANFGDKPESAGNWNMIDFYQGATLDKISNIPTTKKVMLASHKILHDLDKLEAFKSVACINIKKIPGGSKADGAEIQQAYNDPENKKLLLEQIEAYTPDIMICGYTLQYFEQDINFRKGEEKSMEMGPRHYFCTKERLYINAYHPAAFEITEQEYCDKIFNAFSYWESKRGSFCSISQ